MGESTIDGDGMTQISLDADGKPVISSDKPINLSPGLPVTDVRIDVLELTAIELVKEDGKRTIRGQYADGGSFEISINSVDGKLHTSGSQVTTRVEDGGDKSHTVLSFLPRVKFVKKATH